MAASKDIIQAWEEVSNTVKKFVMIGGPILSMEDNYDLEGAVRDGIVAANGENVYVDIHA